MIYGFTGTRVGMTPTQKREVRAFLQQHRPTSVHHGDCIGADADFDALCVGLRIPRTCWPGHDINGEQPSRAFCECEMIQDSHRYLVRDRFIVLHGKDLLIACPKGYREERRSGTWATIRMAREVGREVKIFWPQGIPTVRGKL